MLDVVQTSIARRMWRISKLFHRPLSDPSMQELNPYDLEFYELSMVADDPKALEALENHFYDDEFDAWVDEFDAEQEALAQERRLHGDTTPADSSDPVVPTEDSRTGAEVIPEDDDYEVSEPVSDDDWEEV